jgi:hypothetical protein
MPIRWHFYVDGGRVTGVCFLSMAYHQGTTGIQRVFGGQTRLDDGDMVIFGKPRRDAFKTLRALIFLSIFAIYGIFSPGVYFKSERITGIFDMINNIICGYKEAKNMCYREKLFGDTNGVERGSPYVGVAPSTVRRKNCSINGIIWK